MSVRSPEPIELPREVCTLYPRASRLEWLLTNGTGGFAMGTVAGSNTRRYHGLLVASLHPPVQRVVTLARLEETVLTREGAVPLSVNQYPSTLYPDGYTLLVRFSLDDGPVWIWSVGGVEVERRVLLVPGEQTVVVRYASSAPLRLRVEPLLAFRDYHGLTHRNPDASTGFEEQPTADGRVVRFQPYAGLPSLRIAHRGGPFAGAPVWHENVEYLEELDRGLDFREDLLLPGSFELEVAPGRPAVVAATVESGASPDLQALGGLFRRAEAEVRPPSASGPVRRADQLAEGRARLEGAAEAYLVRRADRSATVIAGYPWFTDWGRDTMISLPGLLVARGQLELGREILEGFLAHLDGGLVPNRFPDAGGPAEYNTVDATLFMFQAVHAWEQAGGSPAFIRDVFYPAACAIVDAHLRGTHHGIHVDPSDGLLVAGGPGTNLTWMDARVNGVPVTPRHGKPVEVNALWYNALRLSERWARQLGDGAQARSFGREADLVAGAFDRAFWNDARRCCFDVVLPEGPDARLRPNQLFAVGLPFPLLDGRRRAMVLEAVEAALVTPVGLRTLARGDPGYRSTYRGGPAERDSAYHQGLVWPWLVGPYVDALFAVRGDSAETRARARAAIGSLVARMEAGCLGQLPECFEPEPPFRPVGAPAQAWSVAEVLRVLVRAGEG
ncbi:MAG TPA: amylo-alpha-1,6-glucosidase [Myxococcaceae bacterium]|nr:amylo-alpha-1,6-glucosidase [Myxococcaceae bacterium]